MSNLKKTSADIKKKLSFSDYSKPVEKREDKKVYQQASEPTKQDTGKQVPQQVAKPVVNQAVMPAKQQASGPKTKATYYLGKKEREMITTMYIKRLKRHGKGDRSALVCEAIRLLYEQEK